MVKKIDPDSYRFRQIVRGKIRANLKQYISRGELIARKGKNLVSVPLPQIDIPNFRYGSEEKGGVGQGPGEEGTPIGTGDPQPGSGPGAGENPGDHILEVDVTLEELAEILGEELELPNIQPKGNESIHTQKDLYTGIHKAGPESLRHFKRTYKQALRRQISSGIYNADRPVIIPIREDRRYRSWKSVKLPQSNAVVIYMMDVSGSMGNEQKEIVRIESFWIDTWLRSQYEQIETRYIIHDASAKVVDQETFFHVRESGGTKISSAYKLAKDLIDSEFSPEEWNIYPFHFSDGDNWGGDDTTYCLELLREHLIPAANVFCYGQVKSAYGSGQFIKDLNEGFGDEEKVILSEINSRDEILTSIKTFLGKGALMKDVRQLPDELRVWRDEIRGYAVEYGLDFFEVAFEMVDYDEMNMIASYGGFPTRYPHWRFGMQYEELSKSYAYGLSKIYELVINNDPCYAYLMRCNPVVDQKLVMAHVYGHSDFFKNNAWFAHTNRKMVDEIANHATRVRRYIDRYGQDEVEAFVDRCLSVENLVDIHAPFFGKAEKLDEDEREAERLGAQGRKFKARSYMEAFINPPDVVERERQERLERLQRQERFPSHPERDVLNFLLHHAPLKRWQRDILSMVREEAYYFAPQGMTKIMNEGWASYWHSKIMTTRALDASELIDYADHHSGTLGSQPGAVNPYKVGIELFRDIEERWNTGRFGPDYDSCQDYDALKSWDKKLGQGRDKIFQVRKIYNDITFIDEFLTPDFCDRHKLFTYRFDRQSGQYVIDSRDFRDIKSKFLDSLSNFGRPLIAIDDANFKNRGDLHLSHEFSGVPLKLDYARATLQNLHALWGRGVHLETVVDGKKKLLSFNGSRHEEKVLG